MKKLETLELTTRLTACILFLFFFTFWVPAARAHPHVFIIQRLQVVFDEKGLAGIKVRWKFDDMFASMIAEDHDINHNGTLESNEIQSVKEKAFSFIGEHSYFTFVKIDGVPFPIKFIQDFNAVLNKQKLIYEFLIPCHVTASKQVKKITVASYDPSFYTAIYFAQREPITLVSDGGFEVRTALREDSDTAIYFDMIHPWTLFLEFRKK